MTDYFVASAGRPDQEAPRIPEVFNLEDQLARHRADSNRA
jgi:L-rhamnose mutarotase